jgi:hypothetical protein
LMITWELCASVIWDGFGTSMPEVQTAHWRCDVQLNTATADGGFQG